MAHISFDVWGTLFESNPRNNSERAIYLKDKFKINSDLTYIERVIKENGKFVNSIQESTGIQLTRAEIYQQLFKELDIQIEKKDIELVDRKFQDFFIEYPPRFYDLNYIDLILNLKKNNTTSILSNTVYITGNKIQFILNGLLGVNFFDFSIYSDELGFSKPHDKIYLKLIEKADMHPNKIYHIGDNILCDVESPRKFKINTIQVHSNNKSINNVIDEIK